MKTLLLLFGIISIILGIWCICTTKGWDWKDVASLNLLLLGIVMICLSISN